MSRPDMDISTLNAVSTSASRLRGASFWQCVGRNLTEKIGFRLDYLVEEYLVL